MKRDDGCWIFFHNCNLQISKLCVYILITIMGFVFLVVLVFLVSSSSSSSKSSFAQEHVMVTVKGVTNIATTDDNFVCATLDWWPSSKCIFNQCPWGMAGILNLDLNNTILTKAIKAFSSLRIRIGGSPQDQILYKVGNAIEECPSFENKTDGLFGYSKGCLTMERWDQINNLINQTGAVVTFGLNALFGRKKVTNDNLYIGNWNPNNTYDLIKYTVSKGYNIESWEFGNELSGFGIGARVGAIQYAKDVITLKRILNELYKNITTQPKLLAPGGFFHKEWFSTFLQATGPNVVDGITHHIYNLGEGIDPNLLKRMKDPFFLDQIAQTYKDLEKVLQSFGPSSSAWVGESGGAYNSGGKHISHTFVNSFWYLDQLGMTSTFNHKVFCRQTLIGGNYGLLNTTTFVPNPDYYSALLWHRLMGKIVLSTTHNGSAHLRTYSHCSKKKPGITLLLINMSKSASFNVSVVDDLSIYPRDSKVSQAGQPREEYHLTPKDGNLQSDVVLLNGAPLLLTETSDIPALKPTLVDSSKFIYIAPDSIVFVTLRDFNAPVCA